MRILHLIQRYAPYRGGSELVFGELSARLQARGHAVTVYTTDAWDLEHFWAAGHRRLTVEREVIDGVEVVRWPVRHVPLGRLAYPIVRRLMTHLSDLPLPGTLGLLERLGRFSPWLPTLQRQLARLEPPGRFDVVHAANATLESMILAGRDYTRRANLPFVITPFLHLGASNQGRVGKYYAMAHQNELLRRANGVVAMTNLERTALLRRGVLPRRVVVNSPAVDPASVTGGDGAAFRARHGLSTAPLVFTMGANAYDKGTVHLVEAVRRLWAGGRAVELVLAGPRLTHFDRYLAGLPEADHQRLRVLGPIDDAERRDLYAAGDIFAMPSRTDSFGIVYLEAWAVGLPVIGALAGAVPDVIRSGVDGLLVPFGDVPALAAAIDGLLAEPERARAYGAAGQATLAERTWDRATDTIEALYERLVRQRAAGRRLNSLPG